MVNKKIQVDTPDGDCIIGYVAGWTDLDSLFRITDETTGETFEVNGWTATITELED